MIDAKSLLKKLIAVPSYSRDESRRADMLMTELATYAPERLYNNVWCKNRHFDADKPTLLLNSHIDTVRPAPSWTLDPHKPIEADGRLYGLGSNDAGASVVTLINLFEHYYDALLPFNIILALTAEEEVGGEHGIRALLPHLKASDIVPAMAIVGEPTGMQPAVAERGLVVLDCVAHGVAGHAARNEGVNAIYKAIGDIELLRNFTFPRVSSTLGPIKISVTQIEAGTQHNVVPDQCRFVVDVRTTDAYTNEETAKLIGQCLQSDVKERSTRVQASVLRPEHPLYQAAVAIGGEPFVSPTTSDMSLMHNIQSLKIGPGDSARSHKADEYILIDEFMAALDIYKQLIDKLIDGYKTLE